VSGTVNFLTDGSAPYVIDIQDGGLALNTSYTRTLTAASGGFQLNGAPLAAGTTFVLGTEYVLTSADFDSFTNVSLGVDASNSQLLVLTFTPVPEPATILGIVVAAILVKRVRNKRLCRHDSRCGAYSA
jgi:hypothetical protein